MAFFVLLLSALVSFCALASDAEDVNPFVGPSGVGHTTPEAVCPFGLVQAGTDTGNGAWDYCSRYPIDPCGGGCVAFDKTMMAMCLGLTMSLRANDWIPKEPTGQGLQRVIDACAAAGGGRVVVPRGEYPCGSLRLRSNIELHLKEGARLVGSTNSADYADIPVSVTSISPERSHKAFLQAWNATNITISGTGMIDGRGPEFFDRSAPTTRFWPKPPTPRPRMLQLVRCRGVRLSGVKFKDSPGWTMLLRFCEDVTIDGIVIDNDQRMINSDGIDIDSCRHVIVRNSNLKTGDDGVILRAIPEQSEISLCEDVLVEDCTMDAACQAVRVGCPSDGVIRNVTIRNVKARGYNGINFEYPVRYLNAENEGTADVSDIVFDGFSGQFTNCAVQIVVGPGVKIRGVRDVVFRNFDVSAGHPPRFCGNADSPLTDISLEGFSSVSKTPGVPYTAVATEPLRLKKCMFDGVSVSEDEIVTPRGRRQPLVRGRIGARIGERHRLVRADDWYGYRRIVFDFMGEEAWVVLPKEEVKRDVPWTWTMEWPTAFVRRTGALEMLAHGWPHVTLRPGHFERDGVSFVHTPGNMNDRRLEASRAFQKFLVDELCFAPKANLIGMSWGGFYSIRYAGTYPGCVARMYLDAPLCDFTTLPNWADGRRKGCLEYYGVSKDYEGKDDPRMPINMAAAVARGGVEVLLLYGGQDQTVPPSANCELWARRFREAGGRLQNGIADEEGRGRLAYGHHPHGLEIDQQNKLADFFLALPRAACRVPSEEMSVR